MNVLKSLIGILMLLLFVTSLSVPVTSCTKTQTLRDTTIHVITDTIIIKDTVYDIKDGLVAYYNFFNGNLNDSSGLSNNIVFNNATPSTDRFGHLNGAYSFSGGKYMRVSNSSSLSPAGQVTMMAIVKFNGFYTGSAWGNEIFMKGPDDATGGIYGMRVHPTSYDFSQPIDTSTEIFTPFYGNGGNAGIADSSDIIHSGTWYTVVYTYDGIQAKIYLNGVLKNTQYRSFSYNANNYDLYIGKTENVTYPYYFTGDIDEIRIYNKVLSLQLIQQFNNLTW